MKQHARLLAAILNLLTAVASGQTPTQPPDSQVGPSDNSEPIYKPNDHVKPPRVLFSPDPEYPKDGRNGLRGGTVVLWVAVGSNGLPRDLKVVRSLAPGFDQAAINAVSKWKFAPATKDGKAVAVQINIEVSFRQ